MVVSNELLTFAELYPVGYGREWITEEEEYQLYLDQMYYDEIVKYAKKCVLRFHTNKNANQKL